MCCEVLVAVYVISVLCFCVIVTGGIAIVAGVEALEVIRMLLIRPASWISTVIAVMRIKRPVDMAVEAGTAAIVRACADKAATAKPLRAVVTVGRATVRSVAVIAVGA